MEIGRMGTQIKGVINFFFLIRMLGMLKIFQVWISIQFLGRVCGWVWATGFSPVPQQLFRYTLHISDKIKWDVEQLTKLKVWSLLPVILCEERCRNGIDVNFSRN